MCAALVAPWGHLAAKQSLSISATDSDCSFQQQMFCRCSVFWFQPPLVALWWNYKTYAAHLHWMHLNLHVFRFSSQVCVPMPFPLNCLIDGFLPWDCHLHHEDTLAGLDQRTRSEHRLVTAVLGGKVSLWLRSSGISLSWPASSRHESWGEWLMVNLLLSSAAAPQYLIVVPGVSALREAGFASHQNVFHICRGRTLVTGWICQSCKLVWEIKTSFVTLIAKLRMLESMFHSSLRVIFFLSIPPHPLALLGFGHSSGTPVRFLLMVHLLHQQTPSFSWSSLLTMWVLFL